MEPLPATPSDAASETLIPPESVVPRLTDGGAGAVHVTCSTERLADTRAPPMARGADRISDLPEGVHHILSLLPAGDAVRSCVLAQSWRNRWRSAPALRIECEPGSHGVDGAFGRFVDGLLRARRGGPPLDSCDFDLDVDADPEYRCDFDDLEMYGNSWIRRVLELNVRELRFRVYYNIDMGDPVMRMPDVSPLSSQHLTSLELKSDILDYNFSGCSVLESLRMERCDVGSLEMHSPSLKRLSITDCSFSSNSRIWMWFPSLVSFKYIDNSGRAPMLETMPHLEVADVQFEYDGYDDKCKNGRLDDCGDAACEGCSNYYGPGGSGCVFLQGLAEATYLDLSACPDMYVFNRDFKWCPAFYKLKSLVLSECFLSTDLSTLIWFLHHTPLVEEFILKIPEGCKSLMKLEGSYNPLEKSIAPSRLQIVEIVCKDVNAIVLQVLKVLNANGIPLWKIRIHCSGYNFVCTDINK